MMSGVPIRDALVAVGALVVLTLVGAFLLGR